MVAFSDVNLELSAAQQERLRRFNATACADIHCHCLPGVDDGPATIEEAIELCRALVNDGVTLVVATPHQLGRYDGQNSPADVGRAVRRLRQALVRNRLFLGVVAGGDVRLDERLEDLLLEKRIATVANKGRHLLLDLPRNAFIDPHEMILTLGARGVTPIITHPERNPHVRIEDAKEWVAAGALFQVTAASLTGLFGPSVEASAWQWVERGLVHLIASDAHDLTQRPPRFTEAIDQITRRVTHATARRLCIENPLHVVRGETIDVPGRGPRGLRGGSR